MSICISVWPISKGKKGCRLCSGRISIQNTLLLRQLIFTYATFYLRPSSAPSSHPYRHWANSPAFTISFNPARIFSLSFLSFWTDWYSWTNHEIYNWVYPKRTPLAETETKNYFILCKVHGFWVVPACCSLLLQSENSSQAPRKVKTKVIMIAFGTSKQASVRFCT